VSARHAGLMAALASLWGASYLLIKYALEDLSPAVIVCSRTALGAAVLYALIHAQRGARRETGAAVAEMRRRPGTAALFGLLAIAAPFLLIAVGEREVPSGLTAVLIASAPLFVAAFAPFLDRSEIATPKQGAGLVLGLAGVALLVGVETVSTLAEFLSAIGIIGAAACYTLSTFMVKRAYRGLPSLATSFVSVGAGALLTLPFALATLPDEAPGRRAVISVVVLGIAGTALAFVIFYRLIAEMGAARASLISYLIPPISLAYGAILLDEAITPAAIGALLLIMVGVALGSSRGEPQPAPEGAEAGAAEHDDDEARSAALSGRGSA